MISPENTKLLLEFAEEGYEFFPLIKPWGNRKLGTPKGWNEICSCDIDTIKSWLETAKFGFGMSPKSKKCLIIDLDIKKGINGVENFKSDMKFFGIPDPAIVFESPSGGKHLIYEHPKDKDFKNVSGLSLHSGLVGQGTGIDIRAVGGFIGSFGARNNGYKLIKGNAKSQLTKLPEEIIKILPEKVKPGQMAATALALTQELVGYDKSTNTKSSLFGVIPKIINDGERDNTLFNLIASWVRSGLDRSNIIILAQCAMDRCEGDTEGINIIDMIDRTMQNPDFVYSKRSKALQILLKNLVFLEDINRFMLLNSKALMVKEAAALKFNSKIQIGETAKGDPKYISLFKAWSNDDSRLSYRNFGYKPINETIYYDDTAGYRLVNTYTKPEIKAKENTLLFNKFREFASVVCDGDGKGDILVEFIAFMIQYPAEKLGIAPVIISPKQGVGKNFFIKIVEKVLGGNNVTQLYSDNVVSNFNASLATSQLIVINESIGEQSGTYSAKSKNYQAMARIKSMITDYVQPIERKGVDIITMRTYTNFIFFSNDISAINFDATDRRFLCMINEQNPREKEFFDSMDILKTEEGKQAILYGLKTLKLKTIRRNMIHTDKTLDDIEVMKSSMTAHEREIFDDIEEANYIFRDVLCSAQLFSWYCVHKFGLDIQRDKSLINKLRKQFLKPLYVSREYKQAKQVMIETPEFFVSIRNNTDSVSFGGRDKHQIWYVNPKYDEANLYAEDISIEDIRDRILKCTNHFISQLTTKEKKPEMSLVTNKN